MNNKKISKLLILSTVAVLGTSTLIDTVLPFRSTNVVVNAEEVAKTVELSANAGERVGASLWNNSDTKGLIVGQRYEISFVGNGRIEFYHDHNPYETTDIYSIVNADGTEAIVRTFEEPDSFVLNANKGTDLKAIFTPVNLNLTKLQDLNTQAKQLLKDDENKYVLETYRELSAANVNAEYYLGVSTITQKTLRETEDRLENAIKNLTKLVDVVNRDILKDLIDKSKDVETEKFTKDSVENLIKVLKEAIKVNDDETANQNEIDNIASRLQGALNDLEAVTETTDSSSSSSGTSDTSTSSSEEPAENNFKWVAEKDGIYQLGLPGYSSINQDLEVKVNGKTIKIKHIKVKTGSDFWVFDDNGKSTKIFELKKDDVVEATSTINVKNFSEKHSVGMYSSLKNYGAVASMEYNPENSKLEFSWINKDKKDFDGDIEIGEGQKTVELNGEIYNLTWDKGVLVSVESAFKPIHYYNNNFSETLEKHAVFKKYKFNEEVKRMTEYIPFSAEDIEKFKTDENILRAESMDKAIQENLKIEYTDTTFKLNYIDYTAVAHFNTATDENISKRLYTYRLPADFKNTEVFKQNVGKVNYTTIIDKFMGGGHRMLVVYAVINPDNTMTILTELMDGGGKGAKFFDFELEFKTASRDEPIVLEPLKINRKINKGMAHEEQKKQEKKVAPRMGSNLIENGGIYGTAALALSLVMLIRKKFPIK